MTKRINTEKAPAAIGPYSQGVAAGNFLFVSGQLPIDPKTGSIDADNVADQARTVSDQSVLRSWSRRHLHGPRWSRPPYSFSIWMTLR